MFVNAGIFGPGTTSPTRFSGSAPQTDTNVSEDGARRVSRNNPTASGSVPPGSPGGGGTNGTGGSLFGSLTGDRIADPAAGGTTAGIDLAAPAALALTSPGAGLSFGKAPFLWPLFIGLDVLYAVCVSLYEEFKRDEYAPPPLLKRMVVSGHHGRKTGRGFYEYGT